MLRWLLAVALAAAAVYASGLLDGLNGAPLGPSLMILPLSAAVAYVFYQST
jgi:UDP-N-acetylmuramyl pentapeptide phosphotransferase/UDP-N-acetylglucosamine-1-phosphate transferase